MLYLALVTAVYCSLARALLIDSGQKDDRGWVQGQTQKRPSANVGTDEK